MAKLMSDSFLQDTPQDGLAVLLSYCKNGTSPICGQERDRSNVILETLLFDIDWRCEASQNKVSSHIQDSL